MTRPNTGPGSTQLQRACRRLARFDARASSWRAQNAVGYGYGLIGALAGIPFGLRALFIGPVVMLVVGEAVFAYARKVVEQDGGRARHGADRRAAVASIIDHFEDRLTSSRVEDARLILSAGVCETVLKVVVDDVAVAGHFTPADLDLLVHAARRVGITPELRDGLTRLGADPGSF